MLRKNIEYWKLSLPNSCILMHLDSCSQNPPSNTEARTNLITIAQANQPTKQVVQPFVQHSIQNSNKTVGSSSTITKLSPIKMVQPLGFPTKLPPPPPQYQTSSTSSSNLLTTGSHGSKEQKPSTSSR